MSNLVQRTDEASYRARADRALQSGRVVSIDKTTNEAILDVGMVNALGNPVYLEGVAFSPQNPPQKQDIVPLVRTNSSPYSLVIGSGAQIGGANSGQVVEAGGAVTSLRKTGETSGQQGDITLDPGTDITITRAGKSFTFSLGDCTRTSSLFGVFADLCARLDNLEALIASAPVSGTGFNSLDFSVPANSMYIGI